MAQLLGKGHEQSLRFTTVDSWDELSEHLKMQLSFNIGAMSFGLNLQKEDGYQYLADVCSGEKTIDEFHKHIRTLVEEHKVEMDEKNIDKPFLSKVSKS